MITYASDERRVFFGMITPEIAAHILKHYNNVNRPMRESVARALCREIEAGRWATSHQGIAFSTSGRLLDGQHRLMAIVMAGVAVQLQITVGLSDEVFKVIDVGLKRRVSDRVALVDDASENAHVCAIVAAYMRFALGWHGGTSPDDVLATFKERPDSWVWVARSIPEKTHDKLSRAGFKAALGTYHAVDPDRADVFATGYRTGAELAADSPILALRNTIRGLSIYDRGNYWRSVSAMKAHREGRLTNRLFEASHDFLDNRNSPIAKARTEKGLKGAQTRHLRVAQ